MTLVVLSEFVFIFFFCCTHNFIKTTWLVFHWHKKGIANVFLNDKLAYPNLANKNFANKTFAIGECPPYFRQYTLMTFANWRDSTLLSPIYPHNFRQLARVHYTFANIPQDFRQLARVHCIFFRVTCKLEKSLWTTLIIESSKTYTDTRCPHMGAPFLFVVTNGKIPLNFC
jgi:hypothetical protein